MRTTILTSAVAACAAVSLLAPAIASAAPSPGLKIAHTSSAFFQYDGSVSGTGPTFDAVAVPVQLRNCPTGDYVLWMTLVQDGVSYPIASTALGVGEFSCSATNKSPRLNLGFYGNGLHPGPATVTATAHRQADGMPVLTQASATVRIPAGANNPA